jgi:hypothetical protein
VRGNRFLATGRSPGSYGPFPHPGFHMRNYFHISLAFIRLSPEAVKIATVAKRLITSGRFAAYRKSLLKWGF